MQQRQGRPSRDRGPHEHWLRRLRGPVRAGQLAQLVAERHWESKPPRTLSIARATYLNLPAGYKLCIEGSRFTPIDQPRAAVFSARRDATRPPSPGRPGTVLRVGRPDALASVGHRDVARRFAGPLITMTCPRWSPSHTCGNRCNGGSRGEIVPKPAPTAVRIAVWSPFRQWVSAVAAGDGGQ
ncbi:MAG: hypothetical protein M3N47_11630 [Chloroflexota bacterium]|nr:hypothetical protein [Chloroflexota bacterium]